MEVAIGANGSTPFQREVREWQRVDPNTGALLSGRLEADRWINGPLNAYGKVVDSQNVSKPNGTQHTQRKQLEVLQARTSSGSLQVVRAQTVQTSSSRWSPSTRTTQSFEGQRFSNGLHLTNGHLPDGHDQQLTNHHLKNNRLLAAPSLKLSTLMKSSTASNGGRSSPHSITNSMSLVQRHQQQFQQQQQQRQKYENESRSSLTDCRYQPTLGEVRVGGGSGEPMESFRNEREIQDSNNSLSQQNPAHLHRGRSVSTDDLSTEWDQTEDGDEPSEWRRVSKIRRSFQFPKSSSPKPTASPRPTDLPENSVSVSRIREELENGRRLSTAMRNNHVDLVALDSILNGTSEAELKGLKKSSFLTAESLKEIRGKLKKLSDESLYKDDFVTQTDIDREKDDKSDPCGGINVEQPVILQDSHVVQQSAFKYRPKLENKHNTNSLENRTRYRDTTSSEWHSRRKSYGFEKMTPQDHSIFRSEPSTDSGIGRSGELSNWSPTENTPRTTIIKFGENSIPTKKTTVTVMNGHDSSAPKPLVQRRFFNRTSDTEEVKRHSIAVDESKYVRDNLRKVFDSKTSIHLNGLYVKEANSSQVSIGEENGRKQKRVEFCKTEVHFAAESGRVNIVETDGKPPPTNNFRRRRRTSGGSILLDAISSGLPVIHFGDEKKTLFEQETAIEETLAMKNNVTVSLAINNECLESSVVSRDEDEETADEISLRGILKNKPIKPKPYHLGENIESNDSLWGVRLRPVAGDLVPEESKLEDDGYNKLVAAPKPELDPKDDSSLIKSVAERIRIVEERKGESGYSTKINLNLTNSPYTWSSPDTDKHQQETVTPIHLHIEEHAVPKTQNESRKFSQTEIINEGLKSTSLIMKTIKSANQFDEAMKRLQYSDNNLLDSPNCTATKLISNMNTITKSSSANSIFQEQQKKCFRSKYSSSLDGDILLNDEDSPNKRTQASSSFSSTSSSSFAFEKFGSEGLSRPMEILKEEPTYVEDSIKGPIAAPRVKVIGSSNAISHQLSQLRRMYDAADFESDDSAKADEEVKLYLGGGASSSSEEKTSDFSGSWSRLKVQRSNKKQSQIENKAEVPKSNVLSIELRSPTSTLKKSSKSPIVVPTRSEPPVAQPRTLTSVKTTRSSANETKARSIYQSEPLRSLPSQKSAPSAKEKEPLKVGSGGARKLREHELSYFGVKVNNYDEKPKNTQRIFTNPEINRKITNNLEISSSSKWKLPSDKPDLLRHSPDGSMTVSTGQELEKRKDSIDGPIYENLKKPSSYNRKKDLQRDEMILSEMTKTANQTLKAVSNNSTHKEHQRRSHPRTAKPLDTIQEAQPSQSRHQQKNMKSKAVQVSRPAVEGFQRQCCSNRPSSASSTESLSKLSTSGSLRRSRSRSRETKEKIEYADIKPTKKEATPLREFNRVKSSRSTTTHDVHRTNASSSEDLASTHRGEVARKVRRSKEKDSRATADSRRRSTSNRTSAESEDKIRVSSRSSHDQTKSSYRSSRPEKLERVTSSKSKAPSTSTHDTHHKSRTKISAGVTTSTRPSASSKRPNKDHSRK